MNECQLKLRKSRRSYLHFVAVHKQYEQECIPVGCVPPAAEAIGGGVSTRHPPGPDPPGGGTPPRGGTPWEQTLPGAGPPRSRHPPGPGPPVDRQTPVNIYYLAPNFICGR